MRLAALHPDIPQNLGALIRLAACFETPLDVIEPCAFPFSSKDVRRAAMDYADIADVTLHPSWEKFLSSPERGAGRIVLLTTKAASPIADFRFAPGDVLLLGRESKGAPDEIHEAADARLVIPISPKARSLNVVVAAGIALHEARRGAFAGQLG